MTEAEPGLATLDHAAGGSQSDRVNGKAGLLRERGALERLQDSPGLGAVGEDRYRALPDTPDRLGQRSSHLLSLSGGDLAVRRRRLARRLPAELDSRPQRVPDRGAAEDEELVDLVDCRLDELVVTRGRRRDLRIAGEDHEPDAQPVGAWSRKVRIASCAAPSSLA